MDLWINIIGTAAAICMICGYVPQAYHTIKTRQTDAIAMPTFIMLGLGSVFFVIQGALTSNWPLFVTNMITTIASIIIVIIKLHNDRAKKK
ncbi:MAG: PQ-loop repeat-containing protein [Bacteroides sp.]|nr:PQ-loop repeat-containing protein [Bacteroides sp.]